MIISIKFIILSAKGFEELVANLLRSMEYVDVKRVGGTADRGVDVEGYKVDEFGHKTKYIVQCKCYDNTPVSSSDIQKFTGALTIHGADRGIFVTSSTFTREAVVIAEGNSITLIDGEKLEELCTSYNVESKFRTTKSNKITPKVITFNELFENLSYGNNSPQDTFIIPKIEPIAFLEGFANYLVYGCEINLSDIEITETSITLKGFRAIDWEVNKVWHNSQGEVRDSWSGKGLLVTDENGGIVYDVGKSRGNIRRSNFVPFINLEPHKNYRELASKFKIIFPKIKRIAVKRLIKIQGIPSQDIYCDQKKVYIASKITLNYLYKGKKGLFSIECISGKIDSNKPSFTKSDARKIVVQKHPELETVGFDIKDKGKKWEVTAKNLTKDKYYVFKKSGNIISESTHEEIVVEKAWKKAKKYSQMPNMMKTPDYVFISVQLQILNGS